MVSDFARWYEKVNILVVIHCMIQAYEQDDQDIMKAEMQTVFALVKVLECATGVICGWSKSVKAADWKVETF